MTFKKRPGLPSFPEWDLKQKTIDSRFFIYQEALIDNDGVIKTNSMRVLYWQGVIPLKEEPQLHFVNSRNELILDQIFLRDEQLQPMSTRPIEYQLHQLLSALSLPTEKELACADFFGVTYAHFLIEEIIYFDGRQIVKVVTPPAKSFGAFWRFSKDYLLDEEGKKFMKALFKADTTKDDRIVILEHQAYPTIDSEETFASVA